MNHRYALIWLLLVPLVLGGCLKARETDRLLYDPARDEFRAVMVLEDIEGSNGDLDYLAKLAANKDHLLAPVVPGNAFGFAPWFLRLEDHQAARVHFIEPRPGDLQPIKVEPSLASIDIRPGMFFVQDNRLCYYHALVIPGKTADALIAQTRNDQLKPLKKLVQTEVKRRKAGGKVHTWAELIAQEVAAVRNGTTDHPIKPFMVLDQESLDRMVALTGDSKQGLMRQGKDFTLTLPLTPQDRDGMVALWGAWTQSADAAALQKKEDPKLAMQRLPAQAMTVKPTESGVVLSIDAVKLYNTFGAAFLVFADSQSAPPGPAPEATREVRFAQDHQWVGDEQWTTSRILAEFSAGTLPAAPSKVPVKPGAGLNVQPK